MFKYRQGRSIHHIFYVTIYDWGAELTLPNVSAIAWLDLWMENGNWAKHSSINRAPPNADVSNTRRGLANELLGLVVKAQCSQLSKLSNHWNPEIVLPMNLSIMPVYLAYGGDDCTSVQGRC